MTPNYTPSVYIAQVLRADRLVESVVTLVRGDSTRLHPFEHEEPWVWTI
jgi:hypothetical protein